jgi:signal transduction histidine kinase
VLEALPKEPEHEPGAGVETGACAGSGRPAGLDGSDHGVAIFDAHHCLVTGSARYFETLRYPAHLRERGTPLAACLRHEVSVAADTGDGSVPAEASGTERLAGTSHPFGTGLLANGCTITVRTAALPDGGLVRMCTAQECLVCGGGAGGAEPTLARSLVGSGLEMLEALNAMGDGFAYFDQDNRLALFNARYKEFYAPIAGKIVIGAHYDDLIRAALEGRAIIPHDQTADEYVSWCAEQRRLPAIEFEIKLASGQWLHVNEHQTKSGGIVSVQSEITVLKHRENDLRALSQKLGEQNILFDAALNNMVQGLCMFDVDQKLIVVNKRYLDLYRFSPNVVKPGISLREIMEYSVAIGNYTAEEADRALSERPSQAQKRERDVLLQRLKDGRTIAVMHSPLPGGGSVATYEDITAREQIELTLRQYACRLENSNRELQDFAFVASHDLQEPLRKIESFGDRVNAKFAAQLGEEGQMYLTRMQNAAGRMRGLINDLLSYSRVTSKAQPFEALELDTIVQEVISDLQVAVEEAQGQIDIGSLPVIQADATQMRQLFQNLISNSLKFRKKDQPAVIKIEARVYAEAPGFEDSREHCELVISDNGIGFDNKYADRIFTIFQRLHGRSEYNGTGIGLATVRKIVDRHGGSIKAEGNPGVGATFTMTFPTKQNEVDGSL